MCAGAGFCRRAVKVSLARNDEAKKRMRLVPVLGKVRENSEMSRISGLQRTQLKPISDEKQDLCLRLKKERLVIWDLNAAPLASTEVIETERDRGREIERQREKKKRKLKLVGGEIARLQVHISIAFSLFSSMMICEKHSSSLNKKSLNPLHLLCGWKQYLASLSNSCKRHHGRDSLL